MEMEDTIVCGMTLKERRSIIDAIGKLSDEYCVEPILIGSQSESVAYAPAIIGLTDDYHNIIYDKDILINCFMDANNMTENEAIEWVEYNVIRSIPYQGVNAPIIIQCIDKVVNMY
jgi:hypothetical protein